VEITLVWLPTEETGNFEINFVKPFKPVFFKTKRTMKDILKLSAKINKIVKEMEEYVLAYKSI
jgi:hypothetical protein